jgi:phosphoserine aminotransferase
VCLKIVDPRVTGLEEDKQRAFVKKMDSVLETEGVGFDVAGHRDAPPGLRVWCGATVDRADVETLTPWLDWAFAQAKAALL